MKDQIIIRPIKREDNSEISKIIKSTLKEFIIDIEGTAYNDIETDNMYEAYIGGNSIYYTTLINDEIVAGCGINPLKNGDQSLCELQKMYIKPKARGKKIGKNLLLKCLQFAINAGYKDCYLETFPEMTKAIRLYELNGFKKIDQAMGNTSHYSCNVWMLKELTKS